MGTGETRETGDTEETRETGERGDKKNVETGKQGERGEQENRGTGVQGDEGEQGELLFKEVPCYACSQSLPPPPTHDIKFGQKKSTNKSDERQSKK